MHGVIGNNSNWSSVETFQTYKANLPVGRTVRVQSQRDAAIDISRTAVDIRHCHSSSDSDFCRFQIVSGFFDAVDESSHDSLGVFTIPLMIRSAEQHFVEAWSAYFRSGM